MKNFLNKKIDGKKKFYDSIKNGFLNFQKALNKK